MRMYLCLDDLFLHLISPARWKMHKISSNFCCPEHQRPRGARSRGEWWAGKLKEKIRAYIFMCFGNNYHACFDC